jgi:ribose 5-phosphate isomerase B
MIEKTKKIAIGCDHAGYLLKEIIKKMLLENSVTVKDDGTYSEESVDYPDFAHAVANDVAQGNCEKGILICGSGNGVCMTANKHKEIRAALCWTAEIAELSRKHNDANVVCIPARFLETSVALDIVKSFLITEFEGGRHERRVKKIPL